MQRATIGSLVVLFTLPCQGQNWCPPGAEWTYGFYNQQASGVTRAWYSADSVVGGYNAQRIDQTIHAYQPVFPFGEPFTQELNPLFTRSENEVVYIWDGVSSTYDTLFWFAAIPGQRWNLHHQDGFAHFDVLDTGTSVVDGIPLRFLVVEEPIVMGAMDTIRERIGSDFFYIDPLETMLIDWTTGWLHCYRDNALDEFQGAFWSGACDFNVYIPEKKVTGITLFPNPGTDHFTMHIPLGPNTIIMCDALGRSVLVQRSTGGSVEIDAADLPAGTYLVRMVNAAGMSVHVKWIKQ